MLEWIEGNIWILITIYKLNLELNTNMPKHLVVSVRPLPFSGKSFRMSKMAFGANCYWVFFQSINYHNARWKTRYCIFKTLGCSKLLLLCLLNSCILQVCINMNACTIFAFILKNLLSYLIEPGKISYSYLRHLESFLGYLNLIISRLHCRKL